MPTNRAAMPESSCCQEDGDACGPFIDQEREIERLRKLIHDAERELENVLVSVYKLTPEKIDNPVLRALRAANKQGRI